MISKQLVDGLEDICSDMFTTQDNVLNTIYLIDSIIPNSPVSKTLRKISLDIEESYQRIRNLVNREVDEQVKQIEDDYNKTVEFYMGKIKCYKN